MMRLFFAFSIVALGLAAPGTAQRQATPEQRIDRLERQLQQVQGRVFQRGQPVDTAGFNYEPAAPLSSVSNMTERLNALERQMADIQRLSEENGNRLRTVEGELTRIRGEQSERISALERRVEELSIAASTAQPATTPQPTAGPVQSTRPPAATTRPSTPATRPATTTTPTSTAEPAAGAADPGEDAYTEGFRLWQQGRYQDSIASLRAFVSAYPSHRRVSWANNLIGRAMLDAGDARPAAEALLANYRSNPRGERAADSLYYLGQALMKLGQPAQACNAYSELEAVFGSRMRDELKRLLPEARAAAQCR